MAITVVKPPPTPFRATCRKCGTVFTYELEDLGHRYDVGSGSEWVKCPSCGQYHRHPDQSAASGRG